jgi:gluconolactonase
MMTDDNNDRCGAMTRRGLLGSVLAGSALLSPSLLRAQPRAGEPPSAISTPPRDFAPGAAPAPYPDPDVLVVDRSFNALRQFNSPIQRLWTGSLWAEGPAWSSLGRYLVWSDIPNNLQLRWLEDDGRVSVLRQPSNNSNGNTFDFQGRQLSCEHLTRRVVRYEHDGTVTVIADAYNGKPLNSPNDVVPHPDGGYWFTDPPYGAQLYEGAADAAGGPSNSSGLLRPRVGQPVEIGSARRELPTNVYYVDPNGAVKLAIGADSFPGPPNGLAFSPDYKKLYIVSGGDLYIGDAATNGRISSVKQFATVRIDGIACGMDGVRADVFGNLWCSSNAGPTVGYHGVSVLNSSGALIGRIRLPEVCGNIAFGGPKRNRLFMAASQSLYAVYVNTQGAAPG